MKTYNIATVPGDGIGKEVVPAGQTVLQALAKASNSSGLELEGSNWSGLGPSVRNKKTSAAFRAVLVSRQVPAGITWFQPSVKS